MARLKTAENATDPATGRPLPQGVTCLGAMKYRTRKLVDGKRINKTFATARLAREWLESVSVAVRAGKFIDVRPLDKMTVLEMIKQYVGEMMQEGGTRRGYKQDLGHVPAPVEADPVRGPQLPRPPDRCGLREGYGGKTYEPACWDAKACHERVGPAPDH